MLNCKMGETAHKAVNQSKQLCNLHLCCNPLVKLSFNPVMLLFSSPCISSGFPPSSTCCSLLIVLLHPKSASLVSPSVCRLTAATYQTARGAGTLLKPPLARPSLAPSHSRHKLLAAAIYRLTAAVVSPGIAGGKALRHHIGASSRAVFFPSISKHGLKV